MTEKMAMRVMLSKDAHVYVLDDVLRGPLEGCWRWRLSGLEPCFTLKEYLAKVQAYPHGKSVRIIKRLVPLSRVFRTFEEARQMALSETLIYAEILRVQIEEVLPE